MVPGTGGASGHGPGALARRLPPLAMGVLALALMIAVLPSSLHVPVTGPGSQAEVAPVPGQGQAQSNLSDLGLADSGTVGSGGGSAVGDGGLQPSPLDLLNPLLGRGTAAQQAHCIGNPPRQTEDPLSPPCVAFWHGDNGGRTWKGVTRDSINIVIEDVQYGHRTEYNGPPASNDDPIDTTARVLLRYFQSRFQTYGRTVHLFNDYAPSASIDEADVEGSFPPFAVLPLWGPDTYGKDAMKTGSMVFSGILRQVGVGSCSQPYVMSHAPLYWCFGVSTDARNAAFAGYVCAGLVGKPAAMATDPSIRTQARNFAITAQTQQQAQPVLDALDRICGLHPKFYAVDPDAQSRDLQGVVAQMHTVDHITTVMTPNDNLMTAADQAAWYPEWLFNGDTMEAQYHQRANTSPGKASPATWNGAFGVIANWRWRPRPYPYYYQAAQEVDPSYQPDDYMGSSLYYGLLMAFTAIQMAGPHLTPQDAQRGLEGFTAAYAPPFSPHAGYSPADHTFIDDFTIVRWDSSGSPPDGAAGSGCERMADGGRRYPPQGPWPSDDRAAAALTEPCQADEAIFGTGSADTNHN